MLLNRSVISMVIPFCIFCNYKRPVVSSDPRCSDKGGYNTFVCAKKHREMIFQVAHCNPMAGHLGQTTTLNRLMTRFFFLSGHLQERTQVVSCRECQLVNPPASPKVPLRPLPFNAGPLRKNWDGPHRAIGTISKRASLCIISGGLCNTISRGSGTPQHLRQQCFGRTV